MPRNPHPVTQAVREREFVEFLDRQVRLSNRTRMEMEVGALSVSAEQWLHQISYMLMMQMMHELVNGQRIQ